MPAMVALQEKKRRANNPRRVLLVSGRRRLESPQLTAGAKSGGLAQKWAEDQDAE